MSATSAMRTSSSPAGRDQFHTLRQGGGISGFTKRDESEHDPFGAGHASTSISAALGLAKARDLRGGDEHVVAVIGDGALTGGLALEGLNNAEQLNTDVIVILNDNKMSISENVGAMSLHLSKLRMAPLYQRVETRAKEMLGEDARRQDSHAHRRRHQPRRHAAAGLQDRRALRGAGLHLPRPDRRPQHRAYDRGPGEREEASRGRC